MNPISLADLLNTHDAQHSETQWLIPDLLPIGLTILHGQPRIGKSWLTLHLALSVALGTSALEQLPTTQTDVLYLGLHDTLQRIAHRTHKLLGTQPAPNNFLWTNQWHTSSSTSNGIADDLCTGLIHHTPYTSSPTTNHIDTLDLWLADHPHTRLLVIDSLQDLSSTSPGTTAHRDIALLQHLKVLADKYHIAVLVTDHSAPNIKRNTWNDQISDAYFAIANAIMTLKRERGQANATLQLSGSDLPDQELALSLPTSTMTWTLLGPATTYRLSQERQDILTLLEEHRDGPLRPKEIAALLHKDVRAITKLLFDMSRASQVRLLGRGHYMTIKSITPSDEHLSQAYASHLAQLQQPSISNTSNHSNIGNDGNHSNISSDHIGNHSNHSNIGNDGNHLYSTFTNHPNISSHSSLDPNTPNLLNNQSFSPIDTESFLSNHPFTPQ